jgi:hypothetical protein
MPDQLPLVMPGAKGHAQELRTLLSATGQHLAGVCDPWFAAQGQARPAGMPVASNIGSGVRMLGAPVRLHRKLPASI